MYSAAPDSTSKIRPGKIYQDVYEKRVGNERAEVQAVIETAKMEDGALVFIGSEARARALTDGIFFLEIPDYLDVSAGDAFSRQFYMGTSAPPYGCFRDLCAECFGDPLLGFHQRINQIEQFLLEQRFWASIYPPEIANLGNALTSLSKEVLCSVLTHIGLPKDQWERATGSCSCGEGSYHLTFNHYRPMYDGIGLSSHKDDGFLTILRTSTPGLEVNRKECWEMVPVKSSYFVVNFGLSMEILTARCQTPISAIMHRVAHQITDRSSFGHFSSSRCLLSEDKGIYQYVPEKGFERVCSSRELIDANDYEIYQGTESPKDQ